LRRQANRKFFRATLACDGLQKSAAPCRAALSTD
jgi:hypothetical protein